MNCTETQPSSITDQPSGGERKGLAEQQVKAYDSNSETFRDHRNEGNKPGNNPVCFGTECAEEQKKSPPSCTGISVEFMCSSSECSQQLVNNFKASCDEEIAMTYSPSLVLPSVSRPLKDTTPFVKSLLESNQSLPIDTHVQFHHFKRDPDPLYPKKLTQRLVVADSKAREEDMSQPSHAVSPLECVNDGKFHHKTKLACEHEDNKYYSEEKLQYQLKIDTNHDNTTKNYPKSLSDRPSSLIYTQMVSCNDITTTYTEKCPLPPSSNNIAVQENLAALEYNSPSPSSTSKANRRWGNLINKINPHTECHRKEIDGRKTLLQKSPPNVTAGMLGLSLLAEANLTLRCPPLQFRSTDYVTPRIPNNCTGTELLCSSEYTAHWRRSVMAKVCRLCLVKGFPVDFQILLFFGGHLARKHCSCYFLDMQCNFHLSIIALSYDQLSKNSWKHIHKCNLGPVLANRKDIAEMKTQLPSVWVWQITSYNRKQIEKRLPLYAGCICEMPDNVHQFVMITVYEKSAVRIHSREILTKSPELHQQTEFEKCLCLDDTTEASDLILLQSESQRGSDSSNSSHGNHNNQNGNEHHSSSSVDDNDDNSAVVSSHNDGSAGSGGDDGDDRDQDEENDQDDDDDDDNDEENDDQDEENNFPQQVESDCQDDSVSTVPVNVTNHDLSSSVFVIHCHHPSPPVLSHSVSIVSSFQKTVFTKANLQKNHKLIPIQPPADAIVAPNHQICGMQSHMVTGACAEQTDFNQQCTGHIQASRGQSIIPGILINQLQHMPCENVAHLQSLQVSPSREEEQVTEQFHVVGPVQEQNSVEVETIEFLLQEHLVPTQEPIQAYCECSSVSHCEVFICEGSFEEVEGAEEY